MLDRKESIPELVTNLQQELESSLPHSAVLFINQVTLSPV